MPSTRSNAPRSSRPVVSHAVWRQGLSGDTELGRGRPGPRELPVVRVAFSRGVLDPSDAVAEEPPLDVLARRARGRVQIEARAAPDLVEREREPHVVQPIRAPQPGGAAPKRRGGPECPCTAAPRRLWRRATRRTPAPRLLPSARASATRVPTPDALSSAPGDGGTLSVCAIAITRQSASESLMPITFRDGPLPRHRQTAHSPHAAQRTESARRPADAPQAPPPTPRAERPAEPATRQTVYASSPEGAAAATAQHTDRHKQVTSLSQTRVVPLHEPRQAPPMHREPRASPSESRVCHTRS